MDTVLSPSVPAWATHRLDGTAVELLHAAATATQHQQHHQLQLQLQRSLQLQTETVVTFTDVSTQASAIAATDSESVEAVLMTVELAAAQPTVLAAPLHQP